MKLLEYLDGSPIERGISFRVTEDVYGAFGGVFGGIVAAAALRGAREVAEGRRAVALDCQFLRGLTAGTCASTAEVVRSGRTLSFVRVEVTDDQGRTCATAHATFAAGEALYDLDLDRHEPIAGVAYDEAQSMGDMAPILRSLAPRFAPVADGALASVIRVPWDEPGTGPEAACLAADMSVGPPVGSILASEGLALATPNPDLSLRFLSEDAATEVAGVATVDRVVGGVADTRIVVQTPHGLTAVGSSCTLFLDR